MGDALHITSPGEAARFACVLEVLAPKPGNVHPGAAFDDATWQDFVDSARVIAEPLGRAAFTGVGDAVLAAVRATTLSVGHNTNLGMVLLLSPLCAAATRCEGRDADDLQLHVADVLASLTPADAQAVYQAIALANPGGLGKAEQGDVMTGDVLPLLDAMRLAADRDAIARQYVTDFDTVFSHIVPDLAAAQKQGESLDDAIVLAHVRQMAREPDSLIGRKCGREVAKESASRAAASLNTADRNAAFASLDAWLREPGDDGRAHAHNPGTTADLLAASLFVALWTGIIPTTFAWRGMPHPCDVLDSEG